jgi:hypothetical protein
MAWKWPLPAEPSEVTTGAAVDFVGEPQAATRDKPAMDNDTTVA